MVVAGKAQESSYVSWCLGYWPIRHALKFLWAHFEMVSPYNDSEVFDLFFLELTFLWFEIEIVFF